MPKVHVLISIMMTSFLLFISSNIYAQEEQTTETTSTTTTQTPTGPVTVQKHTIVTTVPAAKEVIDTPTGYLSCVTTDAAWVNDQWVPAHRVCKYENSTSGVAWIEGYWACTKYTADASNCTGWNWVAAHWEKTYSLY